MKMAFLGVVGVQAFEEDGELFDRLGENDSGIEGFQISKEIVLIGEGQEDWMVGMKIFPDFAEQDCEGEDFEREEARESRQLRRS